MNRAIDAVTVEITGNLLLSIAEEMGVTLISLTLTFGIIF